MTTVVNKRNHTPTDNDVYIGRGSKWGNPYKIQGDETRGVVISRYTILMHERLTGDNSDKWKEDLAKLRGKTLVCYCAPLACHGDVLVTLLEMNKDE
jgi:hypothetical protein